VRTLRRCTTPAKTLLSLLLLADANNFPLKGAKFSNWEGGTRANAFVSGGLIPAERRGTIEQGFTAIDDWCV